MPIAAVRNTLRFRRKYAVLGVGTLVAMAVLPAHLHAAPRPVPETTDDVRRLPIPPVDRSQEPVVAITGGTLIDGRGGAPIRNAVVVMEGDRIVAAGAAGATPLPANVVRTIDATGLISCRA